MHHYAVLILGLLLAPGALSYSVLAHEAIIDASWQSSILPLLKQRFPNATADDLRKAHAYAYGGSIIQDAGYYPLGSHLFSDLVHYVRSGDFIESLIRNSADLNEYAFSLGALAHWAADNEGHSIATNRVVAMVFPKLRAKYGNSVNYEDDPKSHLRVEFAFDVNQVARGSYAPESYHDFIGFEVSKEVLKRAVRETYSIDFDKLFLNADIALGTYRFTISSLIPQMTKVAWASNEAEIQKMNPAMTRKKFVYKLPHVAFDKEYGHTHKEPGFGARLLAFFFRIVPKVGPFRALSVPPIPAEGEKLFIRSLEAAGSRYANQLRSVGTAGFDLPNTNFDTGEPVKPGAYKRADETYAKLVDKLAGQKFEGVDQKLRANILAFYKDPAKPVEDPKLKQQLLELKQLELKQLASQAN